MLNWNDVLNDLISVIEPEHVPVEYIVMAKVTDQDGKEQTIRGAELVAFMADKTSQTYFEARIIVDVGKIKKSMITDIVHFFDDLNHKLTN